MSWQSNQKRKYKGMSREQVEEREKEDKLKEELAYWRKHLLLKARTIGKPNRERSDSLGKLSRTPNEERSYSLGNF